jgi:hypothetical protein
VQAMVTVAVTDDADDLRQLSIDAAVAAASARDNDEETDDDILSLLSPVVIVKEEDGSASTSTMSILSPIQINVIRTAVLPSTLHRPWKRIYSLARDGDSFVTFRCRMEEWHGGRCSCSSTSNGHQGQHSNQ